MKRFLLGTTCVAALLTCSTLAFAADPAEPVTVVNLPAVDSFNAKVEGFGGGINGPANNGKLGSQWGAVGAFSLPLGSFAGVQIDYLASSYNGRFLGGAGAHLFWRNPSKGLVGVYGSITHFDRNGGLTAQRFGLEGAAYLGRISIEGVVGIENGNTRIANLVPGFITTFNVRNRFFDQINVSYYANDNWKIFVGHRYLGGRNAAALGTEYMFHSTEKMALSFNLEGRFGQNNYRAVWAGLRVYFGENKSLMRRHRESDPPTWLRDDAFSITRTNTPTLLPPPPPPPPTECPCGPCPS